MTANSAGARSDPANRGPSVFLTLLRTVVLAERLAWARRWQQTACVLFFALAVGSTASAAPDLEGREAPDFALKTIEQGNLRLSEFRGEVVLINFWASWCGSCRQAMPRLNDIYEKYRHVGLVMLSINLDEEEHRAVHMAESLRIRFPVLLDVRKTVSQAYQVDNMPLTVLIDRSGVVRLVHVGYAAGDEAKFIGPVRALLNE